MASQQEEPQHEHTHNPNRLNVELPEDVAEGVYSNLAMIAHSHSEFVIDFLRMMPGAPKAIVKSRLILTPEHALRFVAALKDNIDKFEEQFGPIKRGNEPPKFPMNFGGPVGQA